MSEKVAAVIVAGGLGQRMNSAVPKQFVLLKGKPVLQWSLEAFDKTPEIYQIILVLPEDRLNEGLRILAGFKSGKKFKVVAGGKRRQDSVQNGVLSVDPACRWVAVHDGARPGITPEMLSETIQSAFIKGSAVCAVPSNDTLVRVCEGQYVEHLDRTQIFRMQTPQIFLLDILEKSFSYAEKKGLNVTDEAGLVSAAGFSVSLAKGSETNIKVTRPEDLDILEAIL